MHFLELSGNNPSSIPRLISISDMAITQTSSSSISPNNINIGGSDRENTVVINSAIKNEEMEESNKDVKISLKVQPNIAITTLVFY